MSRTYEEIHATQDALCRTLGEVDRCLEPIRAQLGADAFARCVMLGSGSSLSVGKSLAQIARMAFGGAACALSSGDAALRGGAYRSVCEGALVVVLSRSGETSEMSFALEALRAGGAHFRVLGICCASGSTLAGSSDFCIELPWAFDYSVCQTRSVTAMYTAGAYLIARLAGQDDWAGSIAEAAAGVNAFLAGAQSILEPLAALPYRQAVVLGDAEIAGLCEEGSLAFKEICRVPSNFYHLLDCRHGPMVLFDRDTLVIAAVTGDSSALERALIADVTAKGCTCVVCGGPADGFPGTVGVGFGRPLCRIAAGIPLILTCQLLSCLTADARGADPDSPEGLCACIRL